MATIGELEYKATGFQEVTAMAPCLAPTMNTMNKELIWPYQLWWCPGPWFNIKMSSYQCRKSHCGDKTVVSLISTMGFPILVRQHAYIESGPRYPWWHHDIETFSASLAFYEWNPQVNRWIPSQHKGPVMRIFVDFYHCSLNKLWNKWINAWRTDTPWPECDFTIMVLS